MCICQQGLARVEAYLLEIKEALGRPYFKKEWYSVKEAAAEMGLNEQTVRKKCRNGQLSPAQKRNGVGRFDKVEWEISHAAIEHYRNHKWATREATGTRSIV